MKMKMVQVHFAIVLIMILFQYFAVVESVNETIDVAIQLD